MIRILTILSLIIFSTNVFSYLIKYNLNKICVVNQPGKMILKTCKGKNNNAFTLKYANNSPLKTIPLKFTGVNLIIYYNGNPMGVSKVVTDEYQQFSLDDFKEKNLLAFDIISIESEINHNAHCHDVSGPNQKHEILISCSEKKA